MAFSTGYVRFIRYMRTFPYTLDWENSIFLELVL